MTENQVGFHTGCGCKDQLFILSDLVEKHQAQHTLLIAVFVDIKKAYDSI